MEINQINNQELVSKYIDSAVALLINQSLMTKEDLPRIKINIGYIYTSGKNEVVTLFKINLGGNVYYFSTQEGKLMLININEELFKATIEQMKDLHECLRSDETELQKNRRLKNINLLKSKNIVYSNFLKCAYIDEYHKPKDIDTILKRALATFVTASCAHYVRKNGNPYGYDIYYTLFHIEDFLYPQEKVFLENNYTKENLIELEWRYETCFVLFWCLGLIDADISDTEFFDLALMDNLIKTSNSFDEIKSKCNMRSISEILDAQDLYYRYAWALYENKVTPGALIGNLNNGIVFERRRGFEWLFSPENDWCKINLSA